MNVFSKIALGVFALGFAAPVFAEAFDVAALTCNDFATLDEETQGALIMWMDGFTGGSNEDSTFDVERLKVNATDADAACAADPSRSLLEVMNEVVAQ